MKKHAYDYDCYCLECCRKMQEWVEDIQEQKLKHKYVPKCTCQISAPCSYCVSKGGN